MWPGRVAGGGDDLERADALARGVIVRVGFGLRPGDAAADLPVCGLARVRGFVSLREQAGRRAR